MQIVSFMLNPVFWENKKNITSLSSAELAIESGNGQGDGYISNKCA